MNCPRCTEPVGPDDVFCSACGAHLRRSAGGAVVGRGRGLGIAAIAVLNTGLLVASAFLVYSVLDRYRGGARAAVLRLGAPRQGSPPPRVSGGTGLHDTVAPSSTTTGGRHGQRPPRGASHRKTPHRKTGGARPRGRERASSSRGSSVKRKASGRPPSPGSAPKTSTTTKPTPKSAMGKTSSSPAEKAAPAALNSAERHRAEFNAQTVRGVIRHYLPRLRSCYERATKRGQEIGGVIEIRFVIGQDGYVRRSDVHSNTTGATGLGRCIAATLARWTFPKPVGGEVDFIYPFVFSSGS